MFLLERKFYDNQLPILIRQSLPYELMAVSEGPKILVAEKGVLASRSWMVHHSADGVHVVSLDDDGWPRVVGPE